MEIHPGHKILREKIPSEINRRWFVSDLTFEIWSDQTAYLLFPNGDERFEIIIKQNQTEIRKTLPNGRIVFLILERTDK